MSGVGCSTEFPRECTIFNPRSFGGKTFRDSTDIGDLTATNNKICRVLAICKYGKGENMYKQHSGHKRYIRLREPRSFNSYWGNTKRQPRKSVHSWTRLLWKDHFTEEDKCDPIPWSDYALWGQTLGGRSIRSNSATVT